MKKRESKLWQRIKNLNLKGQIFRIESNTINGIPDCYWLLNGKSFWIELKSNTYKIPKLDKFQISCIHNYHRHGGTIFIMYQTLSESAIETYRVKGVIHSSTIPQLDLELVHTTPDPVPVSHWTELRSVLLT